MLIHAPAYAHFCSAPGTPPTDIPPKYTPYKPLYENGLTRVEKPLLDSARYSVKYVVGAHSNVDVQHIVPIQAMFTGAQFPERPLRKMNVTVNSSGDLTLNCRTRLPSIVGVYEAEHMVMNAAQFRDNQLPNYTSVFITDKIPSTITATATRTTMPGNRIKRIYCFGSVLQVEDMTPAAARLPSGEGLLKYQNSFPATATTTVYNRDNMVLNPGAPVVEELHRAKPLTPAQYSSLYTVSELADLIIHVLNASPEEAVELAADGLIPADQLLSRLPVAASIYPRRDISQGVGVCVFTPASMLRESARYASTISIQTQHCMRHHARKQHGTIPT